MKRRNFLRTSAMSLPLFVGGMKVAAMPKSSIFTNVNDSDRILVLIQLDGGNDGLNTVIPLDQYSNLSNARANILIPENTVLTLEDSVGLHPAMPGMKSMYEDAKLKIIQSVGYPNQNRSHFRSTDIWTSGSAAEEFVNTGWLGRYFDSNHPEFPDGYPNEDCPDPFAITLGSFVSETCQGPSTNFSMALTDPNNLTTIIEGEEGSVDLNTCYGYELDFLRTAIKQTNAYTDTLELAAANGNNLAVYPDDIGLAQQLKIVAQLISGGLQTQVYIVRLGGFDTHAAQIGDGGPLTGDHNNLLTSLSASMAAFQEDLKLLGLEERVVGMTFSEFGRRIRSNDSLGTDHGTAAPLFVFGSCINPGILGDNPEIPDDPGVQDGVPMQYDFRSVYGSILMDWFEVPEEDVKSLLYEDFQHIPIIQLCNTVSTIDPSMEESIETYNYPNPFTDWTTIVFNTKNEWARLSIFDALGHELIVLSDRQFTAGEHKINVETRHLAAGNYFYRLVMKDRQKTKMMVKS